MCETIYSLKANEETEEMELQLLEFAINLSSYKVLGKSEINTISNSTALLL
jgi:hypothetical protein